MTGFTFTGFSNSKWIIFIITIFVCYGFGEKKELKLDEMSMVKKCKHGYFLLTDLDNYISRQIMYYGEWGEKELQLFLQLIKPGDIVLDVGANIGAFTVPLAKAVGRNGVVHSFEPQVVIFQRLNANIALNGLLNVHTHNVALGNETGELQIPSFDYSYSANYGALSMIEFEQEIKTDLYTKIPVAALDSIDFYNQFTGNTCPSFIKVDAEFMELPVLQGGVRLLGRCKPILYLENNCIKTSKPLVEYLDSINYVSFWHIPKEYNSEAFAGVIPDITGGSVAQNMLSLPSHRLVRNGGDIRTIGYVEVEPDKPYLHQYFLEQNQEGEWKSKYRQVGNENCCRC